VLYSTEPLPRVSMRERRELLLKRLAQVEHLVSEVGGRLERDSLSVSGHSITATIPDSALGALRGELEPRSFQVDELVDRDARL
jgi:hypothetical protein